MLTKNVFDLADHPEYENFTPLYDSGLLIGFSVQRAYPSDCKYKPPVKNNGEPDTYALIAIYYNPRLQSLEQSNPISLSAKVSTFSRYLSTHIDYNFVDDDCPTEVSIKASKKTPRPIDLEFKDEFAFDKRRDVFLDSNREVISGIEIIDHIFNTHLTTVDKLKGVALRSKLVSINKIESFCEKIQRFLEWSLKTLFGRTLETDDYMRGIIRPYKSTDVKLLKTERISLFGYKVSKNIVVTFCLLLLLTYFIVHIFSDPPVWLKDIASNNLLNFAFSIACVAFLDFFIPLLILWSINMLIKIRFKLITKKFKFQ